jgi:hypothetical protein
VNPYLQQATCIYHKSTCDPGRLWSAHRYDGNPCNPIVGPARFDSTHMSAIYQHAYFDFSYNTAETRHSPPTRSELHEYKPTWRELALGQSFISDPPLDVRSEVTSPSTSSLDSNKEDLELHGNEEACLSRTNQRERAVTVIEIPNQMIQNL